MAGSSSNRSSRASRGSQKTPDSPTANESEAVVVSPTTPNEAAKTSLPPAKSPGASATAPAKKTPAKGKKTACKFANNSRSIVAATRSVPGHYISVCQLKGNIFISWPVLVGRDGVHSEPFTKFLKEFVEKGLADATNEANTEQAKFVRETNLTMMCPRRGRNGQEMPQSDNKAYPWMQYVHRIPTNCQDTKLARFRVQQKVIKKMNELSTQYSRYPSEYSAGPDLTNSGGYVTVDHRILDVDIARLVFGLYKIPNEARVKEFVNTTDFDAFFSVEAVGEKALLKYFDYKKDKGENYE